MISGHTAYLYLIMPSVPLGIGSLPEEWDTIPTYLVILVF